MVLDGGPQGLGVVGDRAHPVGDGTGVAGGRGEGEAVGVVDLPGRQLLVGLDEFASGGEHHHARARAHPYRAPADRGEQADLRWAEDRTGRQGAVAGADVAALRADVRPCLGRAVHVDVALGALRGQAAGAHAGHRSLAEPAVGPFDGDDGLGAGRERGAGHDAGGLAGAHGDRVGLAGGDVPDDLQNGGELLAGARDVGDPHRVPVHGAVVERRQGQRHRDVVDQDAPLGVEQVQLDRVQGADGGEDVVQVVLHRPQPVRAGARGGVVVAGVTVCAAAQRPYISSAT
ncbi:hypothetical protein RKD48_004691 [Streptomyces ambofaciens]